MKKRTILKFLFLIIIHYSSPILAQHIGARYQNPQSVEQEYYYIIYDFNGAIKFKLEPNVIPMFSSFLINKYDFESKDWSIKIKDRWIKEDDSFIIMDSSQTVLPLSTPDSTYIIDFSENIVKSFGKKYKYLSQPKEDVFLGYRSMANRAAFMLTYIDQRGNELFNGKEFWEATLFSEGMALVQEINEYEDWKIINKSGDEILNLSKILNKRIVKAFPFINGYANIIVQRDTVEINEIVGKFDKNNEYAQLFYDIPLNSSRDENRLMTILYRVSKTGEFQMLNWHSSVLNDMYFRKHYHGAEFQKEVNIYTKLDGNVKLDSVLTLSGKYYIAKDKNDEIVLVNNKGHKMDFPQRYKPIKCSENLILGKRNKNYVFYNPVNGTAIYFKDKTPFHYKDVFTMSDDEELKYIDEFVLLHNRILKIGLSGVSAILDIEGNILYDLDANELDSSISQFNPEIINKYNCPDKIDFDEINNEKIEHLNMSCAIVDIKDIVEVTNLKLLLISDVKKIINSNLLTGILNNNVDIHLSGDIKPEDLNINISEIVNGSLYVNEIAIKSKTK